MAEFVAYAFADGAYLRKVAGDKKAWVDPRQLADMICSRREARGVGPYSNSKVETSLRRLIYYDAIRDEDAEVDPAMQSYWSAIEALPDTHLGFGSVRGTSRRGPRQKGVDTLVAVDMLVGAFDRLYDVAILIAGDADFVPIVREVHRRGRSVIVAAEEGSLASDLKAVCDRFVPIDTKTQGWFPRLQVGEVFWTAAGEQHK